MKFTTDSVMKLPFGTMTSRPSIVRSWVVRKAISSTTPVWPDTSIVSPMRNGRSTSTQMPAKKFLRMSWSERPMTIPTTLNEVRIQPNAPCV